MWWNEVLCVYTNVWASDKILTKYEEGYNILLIFKFYNFSVANTKYTIYIRLGRIIKCLWNFSVSISK